MKKDNLQSNQAIDREWTGNVAAAASLSLRHELCTWLDIPESTFVEEVYNGSLLGGSS
jgi:hypothetical protein